MSVLLGVCPTGGGLSWQLKEGCLLTYELLIDMLLSSQREHVHPYARMCTAVRASGSGGGGDNSGVSSAEGGQSPRAAGAPAPRAGSPRAPGVLGPVSPATRRSAAADAQDGSGAAGGAPSLQTPARVTIPGAGGGVTPASQPSPWLSPECVTAATRRAGGGVGGATASAAAAGGARGGGSGGSDLDGEVEGDPVSGDDSGDEGATGTAAPAGVDASPSDHVEALVSGGSDVGGGGGGARVFWGDTAASLVERLRCTDGAGRGVSDALWAMLLQTTACMGEPQFELKRMSDQVLPLLTELLIWCAAARARARFGVVVHRVSLIWCGVCSRTPLCPSCESGLVWCVLAHAPLSIV